MKRAADLLFQADLNEGGNVEADGFRIEQRHVTTDHPGGFEVAHAAQTGCRREVHGLGEGDVGDARIGLQQLQQTAIGGIQRCDISFVAHFYSLLTKHCSIVANRGAHSNI